ncbi:MAG: hypothetical protein ACM3KH_00610 [Thiobacillus sp.]
MLMFGGIAAITELSRKNGDPLSGFFSTLGICIALMAVCAICVFGWEWIKVEAQKGKLLPYILVGLIAAIVVSGYFATTLGKPSCEERDDAGTFSSCAQYADDGFDATTNQKWDKFWNTLPITAVITTLIAVIVRNEVEKTKS